jgi:hypothetical protein
MFEAWESLGDHYFEDDRIQIAEIDCEPELNKQVCQGFGVDAYPSLLMFKGGFKADKYLDERTLQDFVNYADKFIKDTKNVKDEN